MEWNQIFEIFRIAGKNAGADEAHKIEAAESYFRTFSQCPFLSDLLLSPAEIQILKSHIEKKGSAECGAPEDIVESSLLIEFSGPPIPITTIIIGNSYGEKVTIRQGF